jgi:hypothetical protein
MTETPEPALGNLVTQHLARVEATLLSRVLVGTLAGALPATILRVERRRSFADRLARRPGVVIGVHIHAYDQTLTFRAAEFGAIQAGAEHTVRGVVLSRELLTVPAWLDRLADLLNRLAADDQATRAALRRALR